MNTTSLSSLVVRLGAIIVLPVLFFVPVGVFIDRVYESLPLATISALVVSACVSTVWIVRIAK